MLNKITLILLSVMLLFSIQIVYAQIPDHVDPCYASWTNVPYENIGNPLYKNITLDECPNCIFIAEYYYRTISNNPVICDVQITQIFSIGSGCDGCLATYLQIFQAALKQIYNDNNMGFGKDLSTTPPSDPDRCNDNWAASVGACMQRFDAPNHEPDLPDGDFFGSGSNIVQKNKDPELLTKKTSNDKLLTGDYNWTVYSCNQSLCCRASYHICWDQFGSIQSIETTYIDSSPYSCEEGCYPGCGVLDMTTGTGKVASNAKLTDNKVTIKPNPAQNVFEININSSYTGKLKIEVCDLKGSIIETISEIKKQTIFSKIISSKDFMNGLYIIKIYYVDIDAFDSNNVIINK